MASLQPSLPGLGNARLRDLTGHDERAVERVDSAAAIELIERLGARAQAAQLTAFERDRLLASLYAQCYGEQIESTLTCGACSKPFDLVLRLSDLVRQAEPAFGAASPAADGGYLMENGVLFRLPSGEDELSVLHLPANEAVRELLRRCVLDAHAAFDAEAVQDAMEQVAPILDIDIKTSCPECGAAARVRFDMQSYILQSILQDRPRLWRETHILATAYKWSLQEILGLTRADRRTLVSMIEADATRGAVA